ncbi:MBL fold metallo-hydrolase [Candidatus Binatus sp.]|uniref:MBL fold metallo-hydrolase n=1 Tax=Candidatus Binatus sp. TaxID=2811406 RepID=UPI003CC5FB5C
METILGDVFTWSWFSEPHGYNFNSLLLRDPRGNICVDPVEPNDQVLSELVRLGVSRILITNRNHVRAANKIRERTGARAYIHPDDAAYAKGQGAVLDGVLREGEKIGALEVIGVSGKSPGEVALLWPDRNALIVGDAVIGNPPGQLNLLRERVMDDPARLRRSVAQLLALDFDTILVGDGVSVIGGAKQRLRELVASFKPT